MDKNSKKNTQEDISITNKHMKKMVNNICIRELQNKTTNYHCTPVGMWKIPNTDNTLLWQECGTAGTLFHCWWEYKIVQPLWKTVWQFPTKLNIVTI